MRKNYLRTVRIFIGSPGGLSDEREIIRRVAQELNDLNAEHWGCRLDIVGWEKTPPSLGRAQALINLELDECDYFIGVVWNHWGSPPDPNNSDFTSGFEEEFERAKARVKNGQMKDVHLYFKKIPESQLRDPGPSLTQVLQFKERCITERAPKYSEFSETLEFESVVRSILTRIGWAEQAKVEPDEANATNSLEVSSQAESSIVVQRHQRLDGRVASFLQGLATRSNASERLDGTEVARLRLISAGLGRPENDELNIGAHDANLLYRHCNEYELSIEEVGHLISSSVTTYHLKNAPLWHWVYYNPQETGGISRIAFETVFGKGNQQRNAIEILRKLKLPTPRISSRLTEADVLDIWIGLGGAKDRAAEFKEAMLFLSENGTIEEAKKLEEKIVGMSEPQRSEAIAAVLTIGLNISVSGAFAKLSELNPETVPAQLAQNMFLRPDMISTKALQDCLVCLSGEIRLRAAEVLINRRSLSLEDASRLLNDSNYDIRLSAIEYLEGLGRIFDEQELRQLLLKRNTGGLGGLAALLISPDDQSYMYRYKRRKLRELPLQELLAKSRWDANPDDMALEELFFCHARKIMFRLRSSLADGFHSVVNSAHVMADGSLKALDPSIIQRRRYWMKWAVSALATLNSSGDLDLIRRTIDEYSLGYSKSVLDFVRRHGDFRDVARVLKLAEDDRLLAGLMMTHKLNETREFSRTLLHLGRQRLEDLLNSVSSKTMLAEILLLLTRKQFRGLGIQRVLQFLDSDHDRLRRVAALRCLQTLGAKQIVTVRDSYWSRDGIYYYDVIHWFDLGLSAPAHLFRSLASRELAEC